MDGAGAKIARDEKTKKASAEVCSCPEVLRLSKKEE